MLGNWFNPGEGPEQHLPADLLLISYYFSFTYLLEESTRMKMASVQWYRIHKMFSRWISKAVIVLTAKFCSLYCSFFPSRRRGKWQKQSPRDPSASPRTMKSCPHFQDWALLWSSNPCSHFCELVFLHPVLFSKAVRPLDFQPHS